MTHVYCNGDLLAPEDARISTFDHGLVVGDGAFETVLLHEGSAFALERHLTRLTRSLAGLGIGPVDLDVLREGVARVLASLDYREGRIRITVTAGRGPLGSGRYGDAPSIVIATSAAVDHDPLAKVRTVPWPRNERGALVGLKTISYAENAVALAYAGERDADEAIFGNLAGNLCEGSGSNVFFVLEGKLYTPPLSAGCLAGITRGLVLERLGGTERDLPFNRFRAELIDEAFLTSAIRGVQPIEWIDGDETKQSPGPITRAIMAGFAELREHGVRN